MAAKKPLQPLKLHKRKTRSKNRRRIAFIHQKLDDYNETTQSQSTDNTMTDIIKPFDYRKGKRKGGREALRQVGYLMRELEKKNVDFEEAWKELERKIADSLSKQNTDREKDS